MHGAQTTALKYIHDFTDWYNHCLFAADDPNGYACRWNHILYINGNADSLAFDDFYREFEAYLQNKHNLCLPETTNL